MKHLRMTLSLLAVAVTSALLACSPKASNAPVAAQPAGETQTGAQAEASVPAAPANELGKKMFGQTCAMCHAAGVAGAPKPGDKADWGPRIAQGKDTLYKHAMAGFTGNKGTMPPRGGAPTMSDDEVKAAVDYMADQSR